MYYLTKYWSGCLFVEVVFMFVMFSCVCFIALIRSSDHNLLYNNNKTFKFPPWGINKVLANLISISILESTMYAVITKTASSIERALAPLCAIWGYCYARGTGMMEG